jgi:hypothetical protein
VHPAHRIGVEIALEKTKRGVMSFPERRKHKAFGRTGQSGHFGVKAPTAINQGMWRTLRWTPPDGNCTIRRDGSAV